MQCDSRVVTALSIRKGLKQSLTSQSALLERKKKKEKKKLKGNKITFSLEQRTLPVVIAEYQLIPIYLIVGYRIQAFKDDSTVNHLRS